MRIGFLVLLNPALLDARNKSWAFQKFGGAVPAEKRAEGEDKQGDILRVSVVEFQLKSEAEKSLLDGSLFCKGFQDILGSATGGFHLLAAKIRGGVCRGDICAWLGLNLHYYLLRRGTGTRRRRGSIMRKKWDGRGGHRIIPIDILNPSGKDRMGGGKGADGGDNCGEDAGLIHSAMCGEARKEGLKVGASDGSSVNFQAFGAGRRPL